METSHWEIRFSEDIAPTALISIIREDEAGRRRIDDAIWWLLLEHNEQGWKPNPSYATFNTRYDKLVKKGAVGYTAYRQSRCIVPASGFVEGLEGTKIYHQLEGHDALALGGLYRTWVNQATGEVVYSASIITLPPHERFAGIHEKSFPLMLDPNDKEVIDHWLDPRFDAVETFEPLLKPRLVTDLRVVRIDRPSRRIPLGEPFVIPADG